MKIFVTGASGFIGSALVPQWLEAGHSVVGLGRSDESAAALAQMGADVHRGSLDDLDSLHAGAKSAEGTIHLAFKHDFRDFAGASQHWATRCVTPASRCSWRLAFWARLMRANSSPKPTRFPRHFHRRCRAWWAR